MLSILYHLAKISKFQCAYSQFTYQVSEHNSTPTLGGAVAHCRTANALFTFSNYGAVKFPGFGQYLKNKTTDKNDRYEKPEIEAKKM